MVGGEGRLEEVGFVGGEDEGEVVPEDFGEDVDGVG